MSSKVVTSLMAESILLSKVGQVISGYSPITVLLIGSLVLFLVVYNKRRSRLVKYIEKIPGPAAMPFLGNAIEMNVDHDGEFSDLIRIASEILTPLSRIYGCSS